MKRPTVGLYKNDFDTSPFSNSGPEVELKKTLCTRYFKRKTDKSYVSPLKHMHFKMGSYYILQNNCKFWLESWENYMIFRDHANFLRILALKPMFILKTLFLILSS